jgi:hypothetical protein
VIQRDGRVDCCEDLKDIGLKVEIISLLLTDVKGVLTFFLITHEDWLRR